MPVRNFNDTPCCATLQECRRGKTSSSCWTKPSECRVNLASDREFPALSLALSLSLSFGSKETCVEILSSLGLQPVLARHCAD